MQDPQLKAKDWIVSLQRHRSHLELVVLISHLEFLSEDEGVVSKVKGELPMLKRRRRIPKARVSRKQQRRCASDLQFSPQAFLTAFPCETLDCDTIPHDSCRSFT